MTSDGQKDTFLVLRNKWVNQKPFYSNRDNPARQLVLLPSLVQSVAKNVLNIIILNNVRKLDNLILAVIGAVQ